MPHIRAICQATIDDPRADGIIEDGGFGLLQQFRFTDHFETRPGDLSRHPMPEWDYTVGGQHNVEPIPELNAVAPRGVVDRDDMTLYSAAAPSGQWEKTNTEGLTNCSDLWKEVYPLGHPRALHLFFYDARGAYSADLGYFGELTSRFDFHEDPSFSLRALRYAPSPTLPQDGYSYLELQLLADPETGQWTLVLPVAGSEGQARYPRLGWRQTPEDDWTVLTEFRVAPHEARSLRSKPFEQVVTWETVDGHFLLNIDGHRQAFYVPPELRPSSGPLIPAGPMRVIVYGHAAMLNVTQIRYPLGDVVDSYVERADYFPVDNTVFPGSPSYGAVAWEPEGTTATATATVTVVDNEDRYIPRIEFTSPHNYRRAVAYLHEIDFEPVISAGTTDPYETQGQSVIVEADGELTSDWRDAKCKATLDLDRADASSLPDWKGNNKVAVVAGWDDGGSTDTATQFTGHLSSAAHRRRGDRPERVLMDLRARDGFRRLERKYWQHLGSFAGWTLEDAFTRVLNQCGIPDSKISYTGEAVTIPRPERLAEPRFDFPEDTCVIKGLDQLVAACGHVWGVDQTGSWFCRLPVGYGGTPDFTLDDDTVTEGDVTFRLQADALRDGRPGKRGFVNAVFVRIDRGGEPEYAWRRDVDSHQEPTADDFIGDDWWHVFVGHDEQSASALAEQILSERQHRRRMLHFTCNGKPGLFPDHFVQVDATGIGVPAGSIFRIVRKHWRARSDGEFVTSLDCAFVQ